MKKQKLTKYYKIKLLVICVKKENDLLKIKKQKKKYKLSLEAVVVLISGIF